MTPHVVVDRDQSGVRCVSIRTTVSALASSFLGDRQQRPGATLGVRGLIGGTTAGDGSSMTIRAPWQLTTDVISAVLLEGEHAIDVFVTGAPR